VCRVGLIFLSEFFNALGLISRLPGTLPDCSISRLVYFDSDGIKFDSLDTCDGYFEYKLNGAHKICVQSFSFYRVHGGYGYTARITAVNGFGRVRFYL
jgi:tRNA(His) 5'-end guanylyltransferase